RKPQRNNPPLATGSPTRGSPAIDNLWARNPIDLFIYERLKLDQLHPTHRASSETLIRRLSLDLTGLPPTPDEVKSFCEEDSPGAFERLVDRLLASPHYGERLAVDWLDGARFADTSGYQNDGPRHMWRWRDWVIDAFNQNQPFDQFTIEQIAGDLLPNATTAQKIATGFQRNHRGNAEGGLIPEEFAVEYVVDRVDTTATVWLGLTIGCARCHDHKYDPISQKEFYQLFAFFNNVPESGRAIKEGNSPPYLVAPTDEQLQDLHALDRRLAYAENSWSELQMDFSALQNKWEQSVAQSSEIKSSGPQSQQSLSDRTPLFHDGFDEIRPTGSSDVILKGRDPKLAIGIMDKATEFNGTQHFEIPDVAKFGYFDKFSFAAWIFPQKKSGAILSRMVDAPQGEGYSLMLSDGHLQLNLVKRWLDDSLRVETQAAIPLEQWTHVGVVYDGSRKSTGIRFFINGELQKNAVNLDQINQTFASTEPLRIGAGNGPENRFVGKLDELAIFNRVLDPNVFESLACPDSIPAIASIPSDQRTKGQREKIATHFLERFAPSEYREAYTRRQRLRDERVQVWESLPSVMVMQEMSKPRPTHLLARGQYDQPRELVTPNVPSCLPALPGNVLGNRLAFAKWLVSPEQPLTARVIVNRYWQMLFGVGLVKTSEDFGLQGERPSHPALLDWLAVEFRESGWDLKRLIKLMVMSETYQQSSVGSQESWAKDPENRRLSRGPRFRLSAETIRDQCLAASGLLTGKIGGPSAKPYQPDGLWGEIATDMEYQTSKGSDLYRRSLYTYWKRTVAPPGMQTFDAPSRETCVVRRPITNTPLQALYMMNEEGIIEAARELAVLALRDASPNLLSRLKRTFRLAMGRNPSDVEVNMLEQFWRTFHDRYKKDPASARLTFAQLTTAARNSLGDLNLDAVELASYAAIASLVINLDEYITKE
ncbi:MAG: DUF1553 domain-containing protein, partial [Pirellula sp.]